MIIKYRSKLIIVLGNPMRRLHKNLLTGSKLKNNIDVDLPHPYVASSC